VHALGKIDVKTLPEEEAIIVGEFYGEAVTKFPTFKRLSRGGEVFFCLEYSRVKRRNSYTVTFGDDHQYGQIMYFVMWNNRPAAVVKKLAALHVPEQFQPENGIVPVSVSETLVVINVCDIHLKLVFITTSDSTFYVSKFPCALKID
jgi:hypothetical protein